MEPDLEDYKQLTTDDEDVSDEDSIHSEDSVQAEEPKIQTANTKNAGK